MEAAEGHTPEQGAIIDSAAEQAASTLQRTDGRLQFVHPKTHPSARAVPLSAIGLTALQRQRVTQAKERLDPAEESA